MSCGICKKDLLLYGTNNFVCDSCLDKEHFKCKCRSDQCKKLFSYNEIGGNPKKFRCYNLGEICCRMCKKKRVISKIGKLCIVCIKAESLAKKNTSKRIKKCESFRDDISKLNSEISILEQDIKEVLLGLDNIKPPSSNIKRFEKLVLTLLGYEKNIQTFLDQKDNCEKAIQHIKNELQKMARYSLIQKELFINWYAAKTFLLCGLRPEIQKYIDKPIQKIICRYILSDFHFI